MGTRVDRLAADQADIVIVGGGLSGSTLAAALSDGRRKIIVLEARKGKNPRFNGELIHPSGVDVLDGLGLLEDLLAAGATRITGFTCVPSTVAQERSGQPVTHLPYEEIPGGRPYGLGVDHHVLVDSIRGDVERRPGVEYRYGARVTSLLRRDERVIGVETTHGRIHAPLVIGCDGRHSKVRTLLGIDERSRLISYSAAVLLRDCELPRPGTGHIFLGAWGPILAYPINATDSRSVIDLPLEMERGTDAVVANLRAHYLPHVPEGVARSMAASLDAGELEMAANYSITTDECFVPGAALVGDANGCSHPITATGMTIALHDIKLLARSLRHVNLYDPTALDRSMTGYQRDRFRFVRAREVLSDALYEVFRGAEDGTRAIQDGIFAYWNDSAESRARSMALLSGYESRLPAFIREYVAVVGLSTNSALRGRVNDPSVPGRVRSLVGLGKKTVEKLGIVARGVRQGYFI